MSLIIPKDQRTVNIFRNQVDRARVVTRKEEPRRLPGGGQNASRRFDASFSVRFALHGLFLMKKTLQFEKSRTLFGSRLE